MIREGKGIGGKRKTSFPCEKKFSSSPRAPHLFSRKAGYGCSRWSQQVFFESCLPFRRPRRADGVAAKARCFKKNLFDGHFSVT